MDDKKTMFEVNGISFDEREYRLIQNCIDYYEVDPAGLPGHALMIIIGKLAEAYPVVSDLDFARLERYRKEVAPRGL